MNEPQTAEEMMRQATERVAGLACWSGPVTPEPVTGGITNVNFAVTDVDHRFFVRVGEDIPVHGVMRFNEAAAARAAEAAGVSPAVIYTEPGIIVTRFVEGLTLGPEEVRRQDMLERIVPLLQLCHHEIPNHLRGPVLIFWVFHVIRDYAASLREGQSRCVEQLPDLLTRAERLEQAVGSVDLVFGHNDLLAANFIDDGERLWLIDWDYAGFNSPLFDLGGLASNNELSAEQERWLLETYFAAPCDDDLMRRYQAMKCASLLRETLWSMVSEIHSSLDVDYVAYTQENLERFERAFAAFEQGA